MRHRDPERGVVVGGPGTPRDRDRRQIFIVERAAFKLARGVGVELDAPVVTRRDVDRGGEESAEQPHQTAASATASASSSARKPASSSSSVMMSGGAITKWLIQP